ncbi:MAG: Mth938-like domain-containing protein [Proteobacteria bacterium]|nr:Mth938-like domain-containing protein [Pseudomonadota bacterium]
MSRSDTPSAGKSGAPGFVPGGHQIDSYGNGGFRFAGMSHQGSVIAMPTGIQSWLPSKAEQINVASLTPVIVEISKLDMLIVGTGEKALPPNSPFAQAIRNQGLAVEVMDTPAAARTYNVLFAEGRRVAAALLAI